MLACYVAATLWKKSFISGDVLEKNVVCITFGQPLIAIPFVEEVIKDFPQFEATIHAIYDKDDFFPRVLYYYRVGCKHYFDSNQAMKTLRRSPRAASLVTSDTVVIILCCINIYLSALKWYLYAQNFSNPFARKFLRCLAVVQEVQMSTDFSVTSLT